MNTVTAQGAPNSLIRRFQEQPQLGVDLLEACKKLVAHHGESYTCVTCREASEMIAKAEAKEVRCE